MDSSTVINHPNFFYNKNPRYNRYKMLKYKTFVIEGIIGSGKTTLLSLCEAYLESIGIKTKNHKEPVIPEFRDMFIKNRKKYAFTFQLHMMHERLAIYHKAKKQAKKGYFVMIDRSLRGDQCFEQLQLEDGMINKNEHEIYNQIVEKNKVSSPDVVVFLDTPPTVCMNNIKNRDIKSENAYTLEYLEKLDKIYRRKLNLSNCVVVGWEDRDFSNSDKTLSYIENFLDLIVNKLSEY